MFRPFLKFILPLVLVFSFNVRGENDPHPDSPTPVLLNQNDSVKVLAVNENLRNRKRVSPTDQVFWQGANSTVTIFVRNVELMPDEGLNAFRVYLHQKSGKTFEMENVQLSEPQKGLYAIKFRLIDKDGFRGQPVNDGESVIYVTWRGLMSNPLKISLGQTGGEIKIPAFLQDSSSKTNETSDEFVGYRWSGDRQRFLEQATFGPTTELDNRVRRIGLRTWLAEQFEMTEPTFPYPEIQQMPTNIPNTCSQTGNPACYRERYTMMPAQQWFFKEAFYGNAQLKHRVAWSLAQIWVTSGLTIQQSSHIIAYHKVLSKHAFGNYRDLMQDMTLNPAMGEYLDMIRSTKNNPNENYAREILQLFSIGLFRLNQDGTLMRDAQNNPIPTYDQDDVNNFAKVFTGWTHCNTADCPNATPGALNFKDPMALNPSNHDTTEKILLDYPNAVGRTIPACSDCTSNEAIGNYATGSLKQTLDNIFYHPNTPPFVSRLLIQHLVTSDPSPAFVKRVADVFANNGLNVRGDLKAVVRAILLDPEARGNVKTAPRYGKLREPVQIVTNLGRIFPAVSWDRTGPTDGGLHTPMLKLAQSPFYAPSVFNYYAPDYIVPGTTLNAPEFALLNTSTAINRTNFLYVLIFDGIAPNATDSLRGIALDLSEAEQASQADPTGNQLLDLLNNKMLHGAMTPEHRASVLTAVTAVSSANATLRVKQAVYLIAASSQYQIQR